MWRGQKGIPNFEIRDSQFCTRQKRRCAKGKTPEVRLMSKRYEAITKRMWHIVAIARKCGELSEA